MQIDVTTTYLEMTSPELLKSANAEHSSMPVTFEEITFSDSARDRLRSIHLRIGAPHGWRKDWIDIHWHEWLDRPHQFHVVHVDNQDAGMLILDLREDQTVEIRLFGLVPEFVGRGLGGVALTQATRIAWSAEHTDDKPTKRVWLHTASIDHEHALQNYLARGFTIYNVVHEKKEMPDDFPR